MVTHSQSEIFMGEEQNISESVHRGINILDIYY